MKKLLFLFSAMMLMIVSPIKAETTQRLTINGEVVSNVVAKMTFDGDFVILTFSDGTSRTADMSTVKLSFSDVTAIKDLTTYHLRGIVDGQLRIDGLNPGVEVMIFDTAGKKMIVSKQSCVNVSSLKSGVYILKAGNQVVKFVKQ